MAPPHNHPHSSPPPPPPPPPPSISARRRCSTAQMCFFRILHIISVLPTANVTDNNCLTHDDEICANQGFVVDLNIQLHPPSEPEPYESISTAYGDNCASEKNDRRESESERATEHSEISHVGDQSSGVDYNGVSEHEGEKPRDEGYLGLLIEAAQLILGDDSDREKTPPFRSTEQRRSKSKYVDAERTATATTTERGGAKRRQQWWTAATEAEWYAEFEDSSPVVRSKRGRNQVLPLKYRDSVVEPLVRWSPANAAVASRRRAK